MKDLLQKYGILLITGLFGAGIGSCGGGGNPSIHNDIAEIGPLDAWDGETTAGDTVELAEDMAVERVDTETGTEPHPEVTAETTDVSEDAEIIRNEVIDSAETTNCPGAAGCACQVDGDCDSGHCIATFQGRVCAAVCDDSTPCGKGFECRPTGPGGSVSICLDPFARLCEPCNADADCQVDFMEQDAKCVNLGDAGSFCGQACQADEDCPDGYACRAASTGRNGQEQCLPTDNTCTCSPLAIQDEASTACFNKNSFGQCDGTRECTQDGLTDCSAPVPAAEDCNGKDDDCNGVTDDGLEGKTCIKSNSHGTCTGPYVCMDGQWACQAPEPAVEDCNGKDDDCNGVTDDGLEGRTCTRTNTFGTCTGAKLCIDGGWDCQARQPMPEQCDGLDDNCNGATDEPGAVGCTVYYKDADQDGFGLSDDSKCLCAPDGDYTATVGGDTDDGDASVHPGAGETCDGKDDDHNGVTDDPGAAGCTTFYQDADGDGYGNPTKSLCLCQAGQGPDYTDYTAQAGNDCDDDNPDVHPDIQDVCDNGVDDNCNGITDTDCHQTASVDAWQIDTAGRSVSLPDMGLDFSVSGYGEQVSLDNGMTLVTGIVW